MSPSDYTLLERWQDRRDAKAFQEIVSRHGAMVYSVCRRILGNSADTEEVAQECFLALAQAETKNIRILGGWLHTSATHRSLDRVRGDKRRKQRERRYTEANPTQVEPTWNEIQHFVDDVIGDLPEELSSVVIGHFLEGRTQAALAQSLKLSPSAISRRIDRAVEQIRNALRKRGVIVAPALLSGMLAEAVAGPVPKSLAAAYGKLALSGARHVRTLAAPNPSAHAMASLPAKFGLAAFALVLVAVLGSFFIEKPHAEKSIAPNTIAISTSTATSTPEDSVPESPTPLNTDEETQVSSAETERGASVSGIVVFRGTDTPADEMKVLLGTNEQLRGTTVTDQNGAFAFRELAKGQMILLAYDTRYNELPEDGLRSEHVPLNLEEGETRTDIRIEVPPRGGQVSGRVYDEKTGAPLRGLRVQSFRIGEYGPATATTGPDGRYTLIGLNEGEWHVQLDNNNPVFTSDASESIPRAYVRAGETTELDFPVDRSISISGRVVNPEGEPVPDTWIDVVLFLNEGNDRRRRGYFKTNAQGAFTFWGGFTTERAVFNARKGEMKSSVAVANTTPGETVDGILLTLYPEVKISGRFTDEHGRPTKAKFWIRPKHPDGDGSWSGIYVEASETFEATMARGDYEIKGQTQNFGVEVLTQPLHVGTDAISNIVIKVQTNSELAGKHSIRGTVVDEQGVPLRRTRLYINGSARENRSSSQETYTDSNGRFSFDGLIDARYRVHATPNKPFEKFAGFDAINPEETPEITIVVRQAAKLRGRVLDTQTEEPIKSYRVEYGEIHPMGHESLWEKRSINSESGAFELSARLDKDWYIRVAADGYAEIRLTGAALASAEIVDDIKFQLSPGRIVRGFVANAEGEPIDGALVFHNEDVFDYSRRNNPRHAATTSDAEGRFELRSLPEEAQRIYIFKPDYAVAQALIDDEMNFVLTQGGIIEGRIQFGGAAPEGNLNVSVYRIINGKPAIRSGTVDEEGFYRVQKLVDGTYQFQVRPAENDGRRIDPSYYLEEEVEAFDGSVTTFDIWIPIGSAVLEGVISQGGAPVQLPLRYTSGGYFSYVFTDETGYYRIDNLPEGPVRVDAHLPDERNPGATYYRTIIDAKLEPGTQVRRDFDLSTPE